LIDAQKPLVHERGDSERPDIAKNVNAEKLEPNAIAPFVTPQLLHEYDLVVHPVSGAQAQGDPLDRDPDAVRRDLDNGWTRPRIALDVHGVVATLDAKTEQWTVDAAATQKKRDEMRAARKKRGVPFKEWWAAERKKVEAKADMN